MPGNERVRVLIIDDHLVLAEGLQLALGKHQDLEVLSIHASAAEGVAAAERHQPDVVLADFHLPDATGAEAAAKIRRLSPETAVVILSGDSSDRSMLAAVEAGVSAYLVKTELASGIADVVRRVARGEMLIKPSTLARLLEQGRLAKSTEALTGREREILALLDAGLDSEAMADRLGISVTTVRGHVQNLIEKLGAHSRLEALAIARSRGLVATR